MDNQNFCHHGLKYSLTSPIDRSPQCNTCGAENIQENKNGYLYCVECNYDKCYDCIQKAIKQKIDHQKLKDQILKYTKKGGEKGVEIAASTTINKAVQAAVGGVVPGVASAVLMHIYGIEGAIEGDGNKVIKSVTSGFGGLSGAVIGTAICPGVGTLVGGMVGGLLGALGGWGTCELLGI